MKVKSEIRCDRCGVIMVYKSNEVMEDRREKYINCLGCGNKIHLSWINEIGDKTEARL